jgi:hypothetical protein
VIWNSPRPPSALVRGANADSAAATPINTSGSSPKSAAASWIAAS